MFVLALLALFAQGAPDSLSNGRQAGERAPDSARVLGAARSAQRSFEAFRRGHLPVNRAGGHPECDVRIGRYCYWRGDENDDTEQPPEDRSIGVRRSSLIKELEHSAARQPGDEWIAGQRVRYLVEAGRTDDAWQYATHDCMASRAWCLALGGYAAHRAQRFADADSAYTEALAAMPLPERCRWLDASIILDAALHERFKQTNCDGRQAFVRRLLVLGAPFYSVSTTDLFTEHLARITRNRMAESAATENGISFADDYRELVMRYGWPQWYSRSLPDFGSQQAPTITGHDAGMPYNYLPALRALDHVSETSADDWKLDDRQARTGYAPVYLKTMHTIPSQIARFWRGDSSLVIAAWDASRDQTMVGRKLDAALVLAGANTALAIERVRETNPVGRISVAGILDSGLVSLELFSKENRAGGRSRIGIGARPDGRVSVSDLLLYTSIEAVPRNLEDVRDSALPSSRLPLRKRVGVFWEMYGLRRDGEPTKFTLTVEEAPSGFLRRVAERLRFADPATSLRLQWEEVTRPMDGIASRGLQVDLSRLHRGRYRMQLEVTTEGHSVVTSREVEVP